MSDLKVCGGEFGSSGVCLKCGMAGILSPLGCQAPIAVAAPAQPKGHQTPHPDLFRIAKAAGVQEDEPYTIGDVADKVEAMREDLDIYEGNRQAQYGGGEE